MIVVLAILDLDKFTTTEHYNLNHTTTTSLQNCFETPHTNDLP